MVHSGPGGARRARGRMAAGRGGAGGAGGARGGGAFGAQRAALERGLREGLGLRPAALPAGLAREHRAASSSGSGAVVQSLAFVGPRARLARVTALEAPGVQALNCVVFPEPELEAPVLGLDLVSLGGTRCLAGFDFHPLSCHAAHRKAWLPRLLELRGEFDTGGVEHSGNFYPKDAEFFSEGMLLLKAGSVSEVLSDLRAAEAFEAYLGLYTEVLRAAPPAEEPLDLEAAQARYCRWQREHDPAGKVFASLFGKEWSRRYEDFLFPFLVSGAAV